MRPHIYGYTTTCRTRGCENAGVPIRLARWDGNPIWCGACSRPINSEPTAWHVPPTPEELGIEPAPQQAAELIAQMTDAERQELAALIAPPAPTLGQTRKP